MSIRAKLILLTLVSVMSVVVLSVVSFLAVSKLNQLVEDSAAYSELRTLSNQDADLLAIHSQVLLTLQHDPSSPETLALHDHSEQMHFDHIAHHRQLIEKRLTNYEAHAMAEEFRQNYQGLNQALNRYLSGIDEVVALFKQERYHQANVFLLQQLNPWSQEALKQGRDLRMEILQKGNLIEAEASAYSAWVERLIVVLSVAVLVTLILLALMIVRSIQGRVKAVVAEIGQLSQSMRFNKKLSRGKDEFNAISDSINQMTDALNGGLTEVSRVVNELSQGDFNQRIHAPLVGDLDDLKQNVNRSVTSIEATMAQLKMTMSALNKGEFSFIPQTDSQGEFRLMIEDAASAMQNLNRTIGDIVDVMNWMNQGKFQHRVEASAAGELLTLKQGINSSMNALEQAIEEITRVVVAQSEGDLTQKITADYHGELRILKEAVNGTADKLIEVVSQAVNASNIVGSASNEVAQGSLSLSQRVQEQAAALEETSATMDQMNAAVQNNTENARNTAKVAQDVQLQANQGVQVMQQTIAAMTAIQESSHQIAEIVTLIDSIAFQTNLLALNAAVEAARAGDHGRGFAVVASEVRALAQKSAEAAKDIKGLIDQSVSRIDDGTKLASESGEVLQGINDSINGVAEMIGQIAQASAEQADGIKQVHTAISQIDGVTQQNAALVEETSAASESLNEQAQILQQDMAFFNTGRNQVSSAQPLKLAAPSRG